MRKNREKRYVIVFFFLCFIFKRFVRRLTCAPPSVRPSHARTVQQLSRPRDRKYNNNNNNIIDRFFAHGDDGVVVVTWRQRRRHVSKEYVLAVDWNGTPSSVYEIIHTETRFTVQGHTPIRLRRDVQQCAVFESNIRCRRPVGLVQTSPVRRFRNRISEFVGRQQYIIALSYTPCKTLTTMSPLCFVQDGHVDRSGLMPFLVKRFSRTWSIRNRGPNL